MITLGTIARRFVAAVAAAIAVGCVAHAGAQSPPLAQGEASTALIERGLRAYERALEDATADPRATDANLREARAAWIAARDAGADTAELHRAIGTVSLQLGDAGRAVLALRRAERLDPDDPRIRESLDAAQRRVGARVEPSFERRAAAALLFWRDLIERRTLLWIAAGLWGLGWVLLAGLPIAGRRAAKPLAVGSASLLALSILAGGSLAGAWWYESAGRDAVVVGSAAPAFRGPSAGVYDRAFQQPLPPGTEVRVIERRDGPGGGWWQVELRDGRRAWVRADAIETV